MSGVMVAAGYLDNLKREEHGHKALKKWPEKTY